MYDSGSDLVAFDAELVDWLDDLNIPPPSPPPQDDERTRSTTPVFQTGDSAVESRLHLLLGDSVARDAGLGVASRLS